MLALGMGLLEQRHALTPSFHFNKIIISFYYTVKGDNLRVWSKLSSAMVEFQYLKSLDDLFILIKLDLWDQLQEIIFST